MQLTISLPQTTSTWKAITGASQGHTTWKSCKERAPFQLSNINQALSGYGKYCILKNAYENVRRVTHLRPVSTLQGAIFFGALPAIALGIVKTTSPDRKINKISQKIYCNISRVCQIAVLITSIALLFLGHPVVGSITLGFMLLEYADRKGKIPPFLYKTTILTGGVCHLICAFSSTSYLTKIFACIFTLPYLWDNVMPKNMLKETNQTIPVRIGLEK